MHGMINRTIQRFLCDIYGTSLWERVARRAGVPCDGFEAMLTYDDSQTEAVLAAATRYLQEPRELFLEDLGVYLVSHRNTQPIRRLLRFGGATFVEFLYSLDELHDRARLAVPDMQLPVVEMEDMDGGRFTLNVRHPTAGFGHVFVGILRAMADDYGALVLLEHLGRKHGAERVVIDLAEIAFAEGRKFELRAPAT